MKIVRNALAALAMAALTGFGALAPAQAAVVGVDLGTAAPPGTLGGFTMTAFGADARAEFTNVSNVASPLGGDVGFSSPLNKRNVGSGWATWSHGYTGSVYFSAGTGVTLTLPSMVSAFYFYVQPNSFASYVFTITETSGAQFVKSIVGNSGANGFGFYGTAGSLISSIAISTSSSALGFAVGEFGIAVAAVPLPAGGLLLICAIGALAFSRRRRTAA